MAGKGTQDSQFWGIALALWYSVNTASLIKSSNCRVLSTSSANWRRIKHSALGARAEAVHH